jgi:hypothetical protein
MKKILDTDLQVQIDVIEVGEQMVHCEMYTGVYCVKTYISRSDYDQLVYRGFFIRDGKTMDSANVINTTHLFKPIVES